MGNKTVTYTIVGPVEANPMEGKISNESPIGLALFGRKVGDDAEITTPKGVVKYKIAQIS
jgi:transcription elongation factor GreA